MRRPSTVATLCQIKLLAFNSRICWRIAVAAFTLICLWPIWSVRFPAMQDYPQHLLQAKMFAARNDAEFGYERYFEFHMRPVYATFFATTILLAKFLPIEIAGKLALTLYIALVATLVIKLGRRLGGDAVPWGLLLFFPFAFNQQYFQGNINYCYSLPLLMLALMDLEDMIRQPVSARVICRHFLWQIALFVTHLYAFAAFMGFASIAGACCWRDRTRLRRAALSLLVGGVLLATWLIVAHDTVLTAAAGGGKPQLLVWMPWSESAGFLLYMFTGMRWHGGVDLTTSFLWMLLAAVLTWAAVTARGLIAPTKERSRLWLVYLALCLVGAMASPFQVGEYTFLNFRLASLSYFFLAAIAGTVPLRSVSAAASIALMVALLLGSVGKQDRISNEIQEVTPVVEAMAPNATVLPLVFDRSSPQLDPAYFDVHLHAHDYYHLLKGGLGPYFLKASVHPVHFKPAVVLPAPGEYSPALFRWEQHADNYQYFLVRRAPPGFVSYIGDHADLVTQNGEWMLFKRR